MDSYEHRLDAAAGLRADERFDLGRRMGRKFRRGSSGVNTAEAVAILRAAHLPHDHPLVAGGTAFLRNAIVTHPRPRREGGRGEWTRYVTFSLFGLTEYDEWRHDTESREAVARGIKWLGDAIVNGGWGARRDDPQISLFHTAQAVRALNRVGLGHRDLAMSARDTLLALPVGPQRAIWPNRVGGRKASVAKTALVALALSTGNEEQRDVGRAAAHWLIEQRGTWQQAISPDPDMEGVRWTHMTFALGAQACLANGIPPFDAKLKATVGHLDHRPEALATRLRPIVFTRRCDSVGCGRPNL